MARPTRYFSIHDNVKLGREKRMQYVVFAWHFASPSITLRAIRIHEPQDSVTRANGGEGNSLSSSSGGIYQSAFLCAS